MPFSQLVSPLEMQALVPSAFRQATITHSILAWLCTVDGSLERGSLGSVSLPSAIMVLQGALQTLRSGVLSRLSIPVNRLQAVGGAGGLTLLRGFAESTYIDKNVVTDRIISVVKNFDKVDPSKVGLLSPSDLVGLHAASARRTAGMQGCHPISNSISSKQAV